MPRDRPDSGPAFVRRIAGVRVLRNLTAARDPDLLDALRREALPSLIEMSEWSWSGHNYAPYQILGRVVGLSEDEIAASADGDRTPTIAAARGLE